MNRNTAITKIRIGSRGSRLALWQARHVGHLLQEKMPDIEVEVVRIITGGDRDSADGAQRAVIPGAFTRAIEDALLKGDVDIAVHSLKDLPICRHEKLLLAAVPPREDPCDVLVAAGNLTLDELPVGASVLTGSPRRRALILERRPDLRIAPVRGNVPTRIKKLHAAGAGALVLAYAGLKRLRLERYISEKFRPEVFLPAPGQGALAVQIRAGDRRLDGICSLIDHRPSRLCVTAERAFFHAIGAGCHACAGALAIMKSDGVTMCLGGMTAARRGAELLRGKVEMKVYDPCTAVEAGRLLGEEMKKK